MHLQHALKRSLFAIPSIDGGALLARMLPTLNIPTDLIVVLDQGSTDNTADVCLAAGVEMVQLGRPRTWTEACNIGARIAKERGAEYLFISNNDIIFASDVARELLQEMLDDPRLGIVAPSQILIDEGGQRPLAYRACWHLGSMQFRHDFQPPDGDVRRLEADFCELTCALIRMSAVAEIGFLDDEYGFYHEDADFGFRLRQAGYASAYLPQAQIEHYVSSTFQAGLSERKLAYMAKNKGVFARKFLGYGVQHGDHGVTDANSWNIINRNLHSYLGRYGLIDPERPELIFSHPGTEPFDYLYTVWETTRLPQEWLRYKSCYQGVFTASAWNHEIFEKAGYRDVHYVPLGIETDVFHPWGTAQRPFAEKTYLWFSSNQYRKALDVTLRAWTEFRRTNPCARLIVMGVGVLGCLAHSPRLSRRWKNFIIADYPDDGISVRETITPLSKEELADLYRSVDFVISSSRSEGFGFVVAEAMACGTLPIFSGYGAMREFGFTGALMLRGKEVPANYSDKGFGGDVGDWWEPDADHLVTLLREADAMDCGTRRLLGRAGMRVIRNGFTWRNTCIALRAALATMQERADVAPAKPPAPSAPAALGIRPGWVPRNIARIAHARREFAAVRRDGGTNAALRALNRRVCDYAERRLDWLRRRIGLARAGPAPLPGLAPPNARSGPAKDGVLFIGYVEACLGLGESLRGLISAVAKTALPFAVYPFSVNVETRRIGPFMEDRYDRGGRYEVNVIEMAADQFPHSLSEMGERRTRNSYNILRTYWELPEAPREWAPMLDRIDEIWVPNDFVARAFRVIFDGPIIVVPPCVEVGSEAYSFSRAHFGMERDRFYFMFSFDYFSFPARKNPLGVLRAFQAAFPDRTESAGLVIKSTSAAQHYPRIKAAIAQAARRDPRIVVIDRIVSRNEMLSLIRQSDCYVSLHRSEGFGLGMAEAMALGNPVIGTNYSGSTDFLSDRTGFPVPYVLRPLRHREHVCSEGQKWAEPDRDAAVEIMQRVFRDRDERRQRAAAAKALVEARYSRKNVGRIVERRLQQILALTRRLRER
jgi:glycosyltransferase involved in cell wall biosynthesis